MINLAMARRQMWPIPIMGKRHYSAHVAPKDEYALATFRALLAVVYGTTPKLCTRSHKNRLTARNNNSQPP